MAHRKKATREDREHLRGLLNSLAPPPASARTRRATVARTPAYELTPSELSGMLAAAAAVKKTATPASAPGTAPKKANSKGTRINLASFLGQSSPRPQTRTLSEVASKSYNLNTRGRNHAEAERAVRRTIANTPAMHTVRRVTQRRTGGIQVDMHVGKDLTKHHITLLRAAADEGSTVPRKSGPSGIATQHNTRFSGPSRRRAESNTAKGQARSKTGSGRRKTVRRASVRRGNKTRRRRVRQTRERRVRRRTVRRRPRR